MAVAVGAAITITKILPAGVVTTYLNNVSLYIVFNGITKRYNATIQNSTAVAAGSLAVSGVVLDTIGTYACTFSYESSADLDTHGVIITPFVGTINISAMSMQTTVTF